MCEENTTPKRIFNTKMELHELFGMCSLMQYIHTHNFASTLASNAMECWMKEYFLPLPTHTHTSKQKLPSKKKILITFNVFSTFCGRLSQTSLGDQHKLFKIKWAEQKTLSVCTLVVGVMVMVANTEMVVYRAWFYIKWKQASSKKENSICFFNTSHIFSRHVFFSFIFLELQFLLLFIEIHFRAIVVVFHFVIEF